LVIFGEDELALLAGGLFFGFALKMEVVLGVLHGIFSLSDGRLTLPFTCCATPSTCVLTLPVRFPT